MALPHEVAKDELVHVRVFRVICASLFGLLIAGNAPADQPTECDRLAGSTTDPRRVGAGIGLYGIEPAQAIVACEAALTADPNNPRLLFNLGRAHEARVRVEQQSDEMALAGRSYKAAADKGYPAAQVMVAGFYCYGSAGFKQDPVEAMRVLDQAVTPDPAEAKQQRRYLFGDATMAPRPWTLNCYSLESMPPRATLMRSMRLAFRLALALTPCRTLSACGGRPLPEAAPAPRSNLQKSIFAAGADCRRIPQKPYASSDRPPPAKIHPHGQL